MMPAFATINEFAAIIGCTPRMVRKHRAAGRLVEDGGRIVVHASIERIAALKDPTRGGPRMRYVAAERPRPIVVDPTDAEDSELPLPGSCEALFDTLLHVAADAWRLLRDEGDADVWCDPSTLRDVLQRATDRRFAQWRSGLVVGMPADDAAGPLEPMWDWIPLHLQIYQLPAAGVPFGSDVPLPSAEQLAAMLAVTVDRAVTWFTGEACE